MRRLWVSVLAIALTAGSFVQGLYRDPCCPSRSSWLSFRGRFEVGGELLYLRPSLCDLDYAIDDSRLIDALDVNSLPIGEQLTIRPDYQAGFRIFVGYISECGTSDIRAQYTFHHPMRHVAFIPQENGVLWPTFGHPLDLNVALFSGVGAPPLDAQAKARAHVLFDYDAVDVQVGAICCKCALWSRLFAGVHYFNLNHRFDACYQGSFNFFEADAIDGNLDSVVETSRNVWAIGPQLGLEGTYCIACGFGVGGRVWGGVVAGRSRGSFREHDIVTFEASTRNVTLDVDYRSRCIVIPVIDARLGVNYTFCCANCFSLLVEFGYEFLTYINAVNRPVFNDTGGTSSTNCQSYDLDGFYLSFRITL